MTVRLTHWRGPVRQMALVALVAALPSLPLAAASDPARASAATPAPATPTLSAQPTSMKVAVREAAIRESAVVATPRAKAARRAEQSGATKQSPGFFKTGAGAIALAVMAVGTGYAIYSASHDKISSPGKQ